MNEAIIVWCGFPGAVLGGERCRQSSLPELCGWSQGPSLRKTHSDRVSVAFFAVSTGHVWGCVLIRRTQIPVLFLSW